MNCVQFVKCHKLLSLACLSASLALTCSGPVLAQQPNQSQAQAQTRAQASIQAQTQAEAQASSAAYTPTAARASATAAKRSERQRKPHWFDERRVDAAAESRTTGAGFERLSYTRYEGEADAGSGNCVYYQNTYTYSCR